MDEVMNEEIRFTGRKECKGDRRGGFHTKGSQRAKE